MGNKNQYDHESLLKQARELLRGDGPPSGWRPLALELGVDINTLKQSFRREFGIVSFDGIAGDGVGRKNPRYTKQDEGRETKDVEFGDDFINIVCSSRRMMSKEDIIDEFGIDLKEWKIDRYRIKTSEGYRRTAKSRGMLIKMGACETRM